MIDSTFVLLREVGSGMVSLMLVVLTFTLIRYLYRHREAKAIEDREARNIAIGLSLFFGAASFRSLDIWLTLVLMRKAFFVPSIIVDVFQSFIFYILLLAAMVFGAICTVRSLNPGPIWSILILFCVVVPIIVVFL